MNVVALFDRFRTDVADVAAPYLWADDEVWEYIDEAQKMFCRLEGGIPDSRSDITQIAATEGEEWGDLSPRILKIRDARRLSDARPVAVLNVEDIPAAAAGNDYGAPRGLRLDDTQGPVCSFIVGMEKDAVRWVPIPVADDVVALTVYRLPLEVISGENPAELEIDEQHHRSLLMWMKHLGYSKQDAETFDKGKAADFENAFRGYCQQAKEERERREHKPRVVAYGGL